MRPHPPRGPAPGLRRRPARRQAQRGALVLALAVLVVLGLAYALSSPRSAAAWAQARERTTQSALSEAKAALLAWSAARGDSGAPLARPGELPCPDTDADGLAETTCTAGRLGLLPWRTLGLDRLLDADGEALLYAVGAGFRSAAQDTAALNSDRIGPLQLRDASGVTIAQGETGLAAVVLAPGAPLGAQQRPSLALAQLVEAALGTDNAQVDGLFISGPVRQGDALLLNDRVIGLSAAEVIRGAERRALTEARRALTAHAAVHGGLLPNAAAPAGAACLAGVPDVNTTPACPAEPGRCTGRLPEDALLSHAAAWFSANAWGRTMPYAVRSDTVADASGPDCSASLTLDGNSHRAVVLASGTPRAGQLRPAGSLAAYVEDAANADAWSPGTAASQFVTPSAGNDQVLGLP